MKDQFDKGPHEVKWYVYRSKKIRDCLAELGSGRPKDKHTPLSVQQKVARLANVLIHKLEKYGPIPETWAKDIKIDSKHGSCSFSKGFCHAHLNDGNPTYVLMWQAFEKEKLINIIDLGVHENFDYKRKNHSSDLSLSKAKAAAENAGFDPNEKFDHAKYNNRVR